MLPFIDQKKQYAHLEEKLKLSLHKVLEQGQYILGPEVRRLEEALSDYTQAQEVITCANGTDALTLCLMAYDVQVGDVVFVPEFTYCATAGAPARMGAVVYFIDIDPVTYTLSIDSLLRAIADCQAKNLSMKGVIAVDLFGIPCDYDQLLPILEQHGLWLIQDAAQAFGARYKDKMVGSFTELTTTSFYPAKPLGCYGDGGAVFVMDAPDLADKIRRLRVHGIGTHRYDHMYIGMNSRLDTLQAAVLLEKLSSFPSEVIARNDLAAMYNAGLKDGFITPMIPQYASSVYAQYCIVLPEGIERSVWQENMQALGIPTMVYYPMIMSAQKAYQHFPSAITPDSQTHLLVDRIVALPMHGYMAPDDASRVIEAAWASLV